MRWRPWRTTWTTPWSASAGASPHRILSPRRSSDGRARIAALREGDALDLRPADYFYRLLALEPFRSAVRNENTARNLAVFSHLLNVFQGYYHYSVVTHGNRESIRFHFFASFMRLLHDGGINEYEDPDRPFPRGHVQVMTIHQAKGLEFPVVVVGSLSTRLASPKRIDRDLGPFYHRPPFEPESRITLFDRMRLHYVAFSRPQKVLALTAYERPKDHFAPIWQGLPQWPYVRKELLAAQCFEPHERMPVKKTYSFTGDLRNLRDLPAPVSVLPPVRLHTFPLGSDLLRPAGAPVHRGDPPHRARRPAPQSGRGEYPGTVRAELRASFWDHFGSMASAGATLIISSHTMDDAAHCHRLAFIQEGRVVALGTPDELRKAGGGDDATLEDAFLHFVRHGGPS